MTPNGQPQFELFDVREHASSRASSMTIGMFQIRHDHAVILAIAGLISVSVVFACGVERGKRLARTEFIASPSITVKVPDSDATLSAKRPVRSASSEELSGSQPSSQSAEALSSQPLAVPTTPSTPATMTLATMAKPAAPKKAPAKAATTRSRFAIQVVTYTKPMLAQRELQRLKQRGEQAFLVNTSGRVTLCIGPFPSREHASAKLASLKQQYQDCFLRTL